MHSSDKSTYLPRLTSTYDSTRHRRMGQHPGDSHLSSGTAKLLSYSFDFFCDLKIPRKSWFLVMDAVAPPVVRRQLSDPLT